MAKPGDPCVICEKTEVERQFAGSADEYDVGPSDPGYVAPYTAMVKTTLCVYCGKPVCADHDNQDQHDCVALPDTDNTTLLSGGERA